MSDEEFLKRWSRRKQEAKEAGEAPPPAAGAVRSDDDGRAGKRRLT